MLPRWKAVFVDLDNTLHDYNHAAQCAIAWLAKVIATKTGIEEREVVSRYEYLRDSPSLNTPPINSGYELRLRRIRSLLDSWPLSTKLDEVILAEDFERNLLASLRLAPNAKENLKKISDVCPVIIVTDGWEDIQTRIIKELGFDQQEWGICITRSHGVSKHDGSVYKMLLDKLNVSSNDILMIGDNWDWDILAAAKFGIETIWISKGKQLLREPPPGFLGKVDHIGNIFTLLENSE